MLIDFWATWCAPCIAKLPKIERIHEKYHEQGQLVALGMSLDQDKDKARQFVKERQLRWRQGFLGDWSDTPIPKQLGISSVPAYLLIDPNGKLMDKSYSAEEISEKIDALLDQVQ